MNSVQLFTNIALECPPPGQQLEQLHGLARMLLGDGFQQMDFGADQHEIGDRVDAGLLNALDIGREGLARQDDALIGFVCGHGQSIMRPAGAVNGRRA